MEEKSQKILIEGNQFLTIKFVEDLVETLLMQMEAMQRRGYFYDNDIPHLYDI